MTDTAVTREPVKLVQCETVIPLAGALLTADLTFPVDPASMDSGLQRPGAAYLRLTAGGIPGDTLLVAPGAEVHVTIGRETIEVLRSFAARRTSHAVADGLLFQGSQDAYEIGLYDTAGTLLRILRRTDVDTTVDDAA